MSIESINANVRCDGCGNKFSVDLDAGYQPPQGWALYEVAEDAVRSGSQIIDHNAMGFSSVQGNMHFCHQCTQALDAYTDEDRDLTADEIDAVISYRAQGGKGFLRKEGEG